MGLKAVLITGRTIAQGEAMEKGKDLKAYTDSAGICELDPKDLEKLGAKEGDTLRVSTLYGEVFVKAVESKQHPHEGIAFIPLGPWANAITNFGTDSTGMPSFKNIPSTIELAKGEKVSSAADLIKKRYLK